jgi:hypothetical protein
MGLFVIILISSQEGAWGHFHLSGGGLLGGGLAGTSGHRFPFRHAPVLPVEACLVRCS